MFPLRHRQLHNHEIQENFEQIEEQLSLFRVDDTVVAAEVGGTKAKKIAVKDSRGKIIGYIPLYST